MKRRVLFQDNLEALAEDENSVQGFVQEYNDTLLGDWLQPASRKRFAGFATSRTNATTVTVGAGRLYADKKMFDREAPGTVDLSDYLPTAAKRVVAIVLYGETADGGQTERDFLIDADSNETMPRSVYLTRDRVARVSVLPGVEAAAPQAPAVDAGQLLLATVLLTPAGYASQSAISRNDDGEIKNLSTAFDLIDAIVTKNRKQDQVIDGLRSDVEALEKRLRGTTSVNKLLEIAADVARLKEIADLPDVRSSYGADRFLTDDETDKTRAGYDAQIAEGLRFAPANVNEVQLELQDTLDSSVEISAAGMILPRNREKTVVSIGDRKSERTGEIAIANYATVNFPGRLLKLARARLRYGEEFRVSTASRWWDSGQYDPIAGVFRKDGETFEVVTDRGLNNYARIRIKRYWVDLWNDDEYWAYTSSIVAIAGKVVAQTYLNGSGRWIKAVRFHCSRKGAAGDVTVVVSRTVNGKPDPDQVLAFATLPYAQVVDGDWIKIPTEPFYLRRGDRIAIHLVSAGDHWFMTADGTDYAGGTFFAYLDGDYAEAMPDRTLCFELIQAEFLTTRTIVALKPWTLDGGIASIDILAGMTIGKGGNMTFEYKLAGKWRQIGDPKGQITTLATAQPLEPLVEARVVMTHTADIAPALVLNGSRVRLTRPKTSFRHFSKVRTLPAATNSVRVQHRVSDWNPAAHSFSAKLLTGAGYATVATGSQTIANAPGGEKIITTVFSSLGGVTSYVVREDGDTLSAIDVFPVDERVDVSF